MAKFNKKKLPSRHTSLGADRAPHRSFYYAMGETEKDVSKPFVGVVSVSYTHLTLPTNREV